MGKFINEPLSTERTQADIGLTTTPKVTCDVTDCERDVLDSISKYVYIARGIACIRW